MVDFSEKTIETYDEIAKYYSESHYDVRFWEKEFEIFKNLVKGRKIIDIGCGAGRDAVLFVNSRFDYTGIDASRNILEEAKIRVKNGRFIFMSFYELDFSENSFDGFWACASLLHVPKNKIEQVLKNIIRIMKKGAVGFISLKEKTFMSEGMIDEEKYGGISRYFSFYSREEFEEVLNENGFRVIRFHILKEGDTNWLCFFVNKA